MHSNQHYSSQLILTLNDCSCYRYQQTPHASSIPHYHSLIPQPAGSLKGSCRTVACCASVMPIHHHAELALSHNTEAFLCGNLDLEKIIPIVLWSSQLSFYSVSFQKRGPDKCIAGVLQKLCLFLYQPYKSDHSYLNNPQSTHLNHLFC